MAPRRVVVTGLGIVSPLGLNLADNWKSLSEGRPGIGPLDSIDVSRVAIISKLDAKPISTGSHSFP
jgi:3-oxoacyl-(acyl-carrier-protein) synthase